MPDRDAVSGEYVSAETAKANPSTTVHETDREGLPFEAEQAALIRLAMATANLRGVRPAIRALQRVYDFGDVGPGK